MAVERNRPGDSAGKPLDIQAATFRFALIEGAGLIALFAFFYAFFVADVWPDRPMGYLFGALLGFVVWGLVSLKLSGLLDAILKKGSSDAR